MRKLSLVVALAGIASFSFAGRPESKEVRGPKLEILLTEIRGLESQDVPHLTSTLAKETGKGFTLAFDSASSQGGMRGLLFGDDATVVLGLAPGSKTMEMAEDIDGAITPYLIRLTDTKGGEPHVTNNPAACASCHGSRSEFTYIWGEYDNDSVKKTWKGFLGEADDRIDPEDANFKKLKAHPAFAPLFPKDARASFPYWQLHLATPEQEKNIQKEIAESGEQDGGGSVNPKELPPPPAGKLFSFHERRELIGGLPNESLSALLGARAARSVALRVQKTHPERYSKFKHVLLYMLSGCLTSRLKDGEGNYTFSPPMIEQSIQWIRADFKKHNPIRHAKWTKVEEGISQFAKEQNRPDIEHSIRLLMLLDYLGVSPGTIMLTQRLDEEEELLVPDRFFSFLKSYSSHSPLQYNTGGISLQTYIPQHLQGLDSAIKRKEKRNYYHPHLEILREDLVRGSCEEIAKAAVQDYEHPETSRDRPHLKKEEAHSIEKK